MQSEFGKGSLFYFTIPVEITSEESSGSDSSVDISDITIMDRLPQLPFRNNRSSKSF